MKKLLAFVMAAAMTLSLAACGGGSSSSAGTSTPAGTSSAPAASSTPADTADFKVGAIYINSKNDTAGYTFQHHSGITKAMENLGLDPASQLLIVDNVAEELEGLHYKRAIPARNRWMVDRSDMVIGYVIRQTGGAYAAVQYARTQGKVVCPVIASYQ